jgi:S-adenosylmethionine synthetase|tara:strand:- start:2993 stop:4198 length:1206 start_codon:yes stop_codon:yes gene_type:complete
MTKRNIFVKNIKRTPVDEQEIEIVERKGIGHPDSLADGIADAISRALCKAYIDEFGTIYHHNTDQVEIVGGRASVTYGGGQIQDPIYILLSGRSTTRVNKTLVPVNMIAIQAAKDYLSRNIRNLDVNTDVIIDSRIGDSSADLTDVFNRKHETPLANDTSFGVSFAPLSETEELVYKTEKLMNSDKFKKKFPGSGEDIKVMGLREKNVVTLTVADAMVARYIPDLDHYMNIKESMKEEIIKLATKVTEREVCVMINTADDYTRDSTYLTETGTSAEMGDDGSVGRGNRVNGLITPNRFMSMEAAAGKNPINHVGKIYNLLSLEIAKDIDTSLEGVKEVYVKILSQIGIPIDQPKAADIQLIMNNSNKFSNIKGKCESIVDRNIEEVSKISKKFIAGELTTF